MECARFGLRLSAILGAVDGRGEGAAIGAGTAGLTELLTPVAAIEVPAGSGRFENNFLLIAAVRLPPEHLFQQRRYLGGRVLPDLLLLLPQNVEKAIQAFGDHIMVDVQGFRLSKRQSGNRAKQAIVLPFHARVGHGFIHRGLKATASWVEVFCLK